MQDFWYSSLKTLRAANSIDYFESEKVPQFSSFAFCCREPGRSTCQLGQSTKSPPPPHKKKETELLSFHHGKNAKNCN